MLYALILSAFGLGLIFLEFFLPGAVMAVAGSILLLSSLYVLHQSEVSSLLQIFYFLSLVGATWLVIWIALKSVRACSKKGTVFLSDDQEGFLATEFPKELIGQDGIVETDLKPSGHIRIQDLNFQAISKSGYIDKGSCVKIIGGQGGCLVVKKIDKE